MEQNATLERVQNKPKVVFEQNSKLIQNCPVCNQEMGAIAGSKEAICINCGFKDPCCE